MLHEIAVEPVKDEERFQRQPPSLDRKYPRRTRAVKKSEQKGRGPAGDGVILRETAVARSARENEQREGDRDQC